jgi:cystathionine beta-lyase
MAKSWRTRLIHTDAQVPDGYRSLVPAVRRGSTTVFPSVRAISGHWDQHKVGYTYGLYGTPTTLELAARICELEGGMHTILVAGGQAAISVIDLALLQTGDHVLIPENVYYPNRGLTMSLMARFGVTATFYRPGIGAGISELIQQNTRLIWTESPESITMEVQDVPSIVAAAHTKGVKVALDNTWSSGVLFDAFKHGVDVTMQALTKYVGGHSDLLLGSITVRDAVLYERLGAALQAIGGNVSPDDCSLALRGLQTLAVRLAAVEESALEIARWLAERPEVERVLHPALPSCVGHELWKRDFLGSSGLFSIVLRSGPTKEQVFDFVDTLELFKVGYSWGGVTSLVMPYDFSSIPSQPNLDYRIVRLNIGLEDVDDLIADLEYALTKVKAYNGATSETIEGEGQLETWDEPERKIPVAYRFEIVTNESGRRSAGNICSLVAEPIAHGSYRLIASDGEVLSVKNLGASWTILLPAG